MVKTRQAIESAHVVLMEDSLETHAVLNALCGLGVALSVDDFGTGFSSLSYLRKYPVSRVKIDKSFVDGLDRADADESLVVAIIAMANALHLSAVAEGVECDEQAAVLRDLGCDLGQGYLWGKPAPMQREPLVLAA